ncbi:hypothetical protein NXX40_21050 [Parabacteroides distasonis]|nr:hypothetical protein [Parabacteroides distasonis]
MKQLRFLLYLLSWVACCELSATPHNIASLAKVSCSSALTQEQGCENVVDQVIRIAGKGEWVAKTKLDFRGAGVSLSLDSIGLGRAHLYESSHVI